MRVEPILPSLGPSGGQLVRRMPDCLDAKPFVPMSVILLFLLVMGRGRMYHDAQALSAALYQKLKLGVPRFTTSGTKKG